MAGNTFGRILRLTTFGESHGAAIGGILDGCPAGLQGLDGPAFRIHINAGEGGDSHA